MSSSHELQLAAVFVVALQKVSIRAVLFSWIVSLIRAHQRSLFVDFLDFVDWSSILMRRHPRSITALSRRIEFINPVLRLGILSSTFPSSTRRFQ